MYSQVSDDEDEVHPNIDTPSLFRWRHQARVERMEEQKKEKEAIEAKKKAQEQKIQELKQKLAESGENPELKKALENLERETKGLKIAEEDLKKKEKLTPWNVGE